MEGINQLWDSGVLGALFSSLVTFAGQLSAINSQKFLTVVDALQRAQANDISSNDAAFTRTGDSGEWVRRIMLFMAFFILGICPLIFAFFQNIPMAVETIEQTGGWFWGIIPEKETFAVAYVNGFYLADVWKELLANLISAYIGAGITRKAFKLGK